MAKSSESPDVRARLIGLGRGAKTVIIATSDAFVMMLALWGAHVLRLEEPLPERLAGYAWLLFAVPALSVPLFRLLGTYRAVVRFMGGRAVLVIARSAAAATVVYVLLVAALRVEAVPRSTYALFFLLTFGAMLGLRMAARAWLPKADESWAAGERRRAVIYGAGAAGVQLHGLLEQGDGFRIVAFLDDDESKQGTEIFGVPIHPPSRLEALVGAEGVSQVLLALPGTTRTRRVEIIEALERFQVRVRTVPALPEIVSGGSALDQLQEVEIDDLLGRDPVPPDEALLDGRVAGRRVLVTGAAGSIGSELCRQALLRAPLVLVLVEQNEFGLYRLERELQAIVATQDLATRIVPALGDVTDRDRLERLMRSHGIESVYHAAAYKHVPMVEANPAEGVRNNVLGTLAAVQAAIAAGVGSFVLVSTDKAVRPTNVMGASKRVAELVLQALAVNAPGTRLSMVRFGNVLDSSGSVVPLFREQIRTGGPVTVTDPEIIRYFMTIREAAQLVLQASTLAEGGEVFVLDMGEPVRILDLAHRMIRLAGHSIRDAAHPEGDMEVRITGLRPGEKLYEELLIGGDVLPSSHPMVMRAREAHLDWPLLEARLEVLRSHCEADDAAGIRRQLADLVDGYDGSAQASGAVDEAGA
ncbi:MAG: nucleoside-diphosphate sugar epimerase/dehydratase [Pseudomonadales bacterium]|jgi:FlaA1/EpsC-like NDP-sugar epimerase|nr:nucleoside-diphosphate sugar epimerase/dehydratase [Pseudomonadales bacterium]